MKICFDMDGTIADLYGVDNWLTMLRAKDETPYKKAATLVNMSLLARLLNRLQKQGHKLIIISWLSKEPDEDYDRRVTLAKRGWLKKHLPSVIWDEIQIVPYGTDKNMVRETENDVLFDDEPQNRNTWGGRAYDVDRIIDILKIIRASPC